VISEIEEDGVFLGKFLIGQLNGKERRENNECFRHESA